MSRKAFSLPSSFSEPPPPPPPAAEILTSKSAPAALGRHTILPGNLDKFLKATTPSVPAQFLSKRMGSLRYFKLEDLWESFKEWSAYGAGVPLVLDGKDSVVQYYVPYLSGIQLYAGSRRDPVEGSDLDSFRDARSDGSSDSEVESGSKCSRNLFKKCIPSHDVIALDKISLDDRSLRDEFSSDDSDCGDSQGSLIIEYLENDLPYGREPLANKILDLAKRFPVLRTVKSCDLLPASWFAVAWYPIYRIPTGPTLTDLDACFLTFHFLSTPMKGTTPCRPLLSEQKIFLPVFGLASLKCNDAVWNSNGDGERKLANTLFQAAAKWLRLVKTNLPDYTYFDMRRSSR